MGEAVDFPSPLHPSNCRHQPGEVISFTRCEGTVVVLLLYIGCITGLVACCLSWHVLGRGKGIEETNCCGLSTLFLCSRPNSGALLKSSKAPYFVYFFYFCFVACRGPSVPTPPPPPSTAGTVVLDCFVGEHRVRRRGQPKKYYRFARKPSFWLVLRLEMQPELRYNTYLFLCRKRLRPIAWDKKNRGKHKFLLSDSEYVVQEGFWGSQPAYLDDAQTANVLL